MKILRLVDSIGESSQEYNQFTIPVAGKLNITVCSYFKADISVSKAIKIFEGDNSLKGFFRVLREALMSNSYDIIHVHTPHTGCFFLLIGMIYRKFLSSTVYTVHNSYQNYKTRNKLLLLPIFLFFKRIVCCGQESLASFPVLFKLLAGKRLCLIQNGVDIDRVDRVTKKNLNYLQNHEFTIITVGRLIEIKNPFTILSAFQQSEDQAIRLVFIGKGNLCDSLVQKIKTCGLEKRVKITGLIPREKVYEYLVNADLFISASKGEGLPIAVLEAMACRCPVIISDIPPHREIVNGVEFIPLVHPDDVEGWAHEIKRFQQMSSARRTEIGEKCRRLVEERFGLITMHKGYEKIYNEIFDLKNRNQQKSVY